MIKVKTPFIHREVASEVKSKADYTFWFSEDLRKWIASTAKVNHDRQRVAEKHKKNLTQRIE